ncbi:hypothetical protein [Brachybacterium hainanense]|uniref:Transposase n=1 Tax=Brachybacterium hainanense TaxID=1541174 RepID=A0ABV6R960_9MICO
MTTVQHQARQRTSRYDSGSVTYQLVCSCGWVSPERTRPSAMRADLTQHLKEAQR